jgi:hypothetical protein
VRAAATLVELNVSAGGEDNGRLARATEFVEEVAGAQQAVEGSK